MRTCRPEGDVPMSCVGSGRFGTAPDSVYDFGMREDEVTEDMIKRWVAEARLRRATTSVSSSGGVVVVPVAARSRCRWWLCA